MQSEEIRKKFLEFFSARDGGGGKHTIVPSSSLIPDDPSVLLTTAGMQQFKRYYTGELNARRDFGSLSTVSIQKCFRTSDIEAVGDESHLTFFEMMGNFSFGGYFKREAITYAKEFIEEVMKLPIDYVTVFDPKEVSPDDWRKDVSFDKESYNFWKEILPVEKIRRAGVDNFWGPTGGEGPCGPTTEIYVRGLEIWNIVFNEFYCDPQKHLTPLSSVGVDTGMGLERLTMVMQKVPTIFETDLFEPLILKIRELAPLADKRAQRILADHSRAVAFLIADGLRPSNKEAGYILRRLMRRIMAYRIKYDVHPNLFLELLREVSKKYSPYYPELLNTEEIFRVFEEERFRFEKAVTAGLLEISRLAKNKEKINARTAFYLYESFGLPLELILELAPRELTQELNRDDFEREFAKHQDISRAGQEKKFGGHGLFLNTGELKAMNEAELAKVTRLHTATHLLHQALREVLGKDVRQIGSDITVERTRFDFTFPRKLTPEEIKRVENLVNQKIEEDLPVNVKEMPKEEAEKTGALHFFKLKYPEKVKVYYIGHSLETAWSKEFCGGPHVIHTGEIGRFRIIKEESSSAGVRRIRAVVD
jgi:alanyl-tRNA synthetase